MIPLKSLSALSRANGLTNMKSPVLTNKTFQYIKRVFSDPLDLSLGFMWTAYVISSLYEVSSHIFYDQKVIISRASENKIIREQRIVSNFFAVANLFKWVDWVGKSKLTGIKEYAFPRLSVIADVFYIYTYGKGCIGNLNKSHQAKKSIQHSLSNSKSKKHYQAVEMKEIAGYISNYSYLCFSGMSVGLYFANTTLFASTMTVAIGVYFLFLAVGSVAEVALEASDVKNKNIHWIKAFRTGRCL